MEYRIRVAPDIHLVRDRRDQFLELREVAVMGTEPARELPHPLDGVQLRTVRRKEEEPQLLPVRLLPAV